MGFRFRKSFRVFPGVKINLNRHSTSISIGVKGAHTTFRAGHTPRTTVGIPGSGLSYTTGGQTAKPHEPHYDAPGPAHPSIPAEPLPKPSAARGVLWLLLILMILGALLVQVIR